MPMPPMPTKWIVPISVATPFMRLLPPNWFSFVPCRPATPYAANRGSRPDRPDRSPPRAVRNCARAPPHSPAPPGRGPASASAWRVRRREITLRDSPRAARLRHLTRVHRLVVVGRRGQRHQDRRAARNRQLGQRRGPGPRDDQMRPGQLLGQVGQIGGEFGRNLMLGIFGAHRIDILDPRLMRHLQPPPEGDGQHGEAIGHDLAEDARPLAAAGDEDAEDAVLLQQRIGTRAQRQHLIPDRIADQPGLGRMLGAQPLRILIGQGDRIDLARDQPVDPAEHRILLMDGGRNAFRKRRQQSGHRRIAAETDHRRRTEGLVEFARHRPAAPHLAQRLGPADRPARKAPGGQDMRLDILEQPGKRTPRASDTKATRWPRRVSSAASAAAGTIWPPVPPAARTK